MDPVTLAIITAALGAGTQAARGKTKGKDLAKGALLGGAAGLGGGALAGMSPAIANFLGMAPAAAKGGAAAAGAAGGAAGAGAAGGFGPIAKTAMVNAGMNGLMGAAMAPDDQEITQPGQIPQMSPPPDPWTWFAQMQQMGKKGGMV